MRLRPRRGANGREMHVELLISVIETYCRRLFGQDRVVGAKLQQSVGVSQSTVLIRRGSVHRVLSVAICGFSHRQCDSDEASVDIRPTFSTQTKANRKCRD